MAIPKGTKVRQRVVPIEGEVVERRFNDEADCLEYHVEWTNGDGEASARWFLESQLEAAPC